ncbi:MAG: glycosyltransferase involved in cell wall biosynthesis [Candidatus Poriferisodalaceae bacterium]|jgi:glycosyltransferase involved in cell wall biosynthesis
MRIVHVFKDAYPPVAAGITRYMGDLAAASAARGHDVEIVVAGVRFARVEQRPDGVSIRRVREWGRVLSMPISPALITATARAKADIVHIHVPNPLSELGAIGNSGNYKLVASFHAQLGRQRLFAPLAGPLQRAAFSRAARVFASSEVLAGAAELEHVDHRVVLAPYGVSPQMVADEPSPPRDSIDKLRVLFVGRLVYYKGIDVLLDAVEGNERFDVTIMGDGALRESIEARVLASPQLAAQVTMIADASDEGVMGQHGLHDVVVLPSVSRAEAFGLSMAEAMANGLPAISTRLGTGTDWVNRHEESGLTVEANNADALRGALDRFFDDALRLRLAAGALERARTVFSFDRHADLIHRHYDAVIAGVPASAMEHAHAMPRSSAVVGGA